MSDQFDPYREALVVETDTIWPEQFADVDTAQRRWIEQQLHADPARAAEFEYVRLATGFCRKITVTAADIERLKSPEE